MHRGYTKRWRKRWDKGYHTDHALWVMMDYFIDFANHKDREVYLPRYGQTVLVRRGQHLFGAPSLSEFLGISIKKVRNRLLQLEKIGFLAIKRANRFSIATVLNYDIYNPLTNGEGPTEGPTVGQRWATPNNDNNGNKENIVGFSDAELEVLKKKEVELKRDCKTVLAYLNEIKGSRFRNYEHIRARLNDGYSVEDCKIVIDVKSEDKYFLDNPKYFNPTTLFRPKNFDKYLNEKNPIRAKPKRKKLSANELMMMAYNKLANEGAKSFNVFCDANAISQSDQELCLKRIHKSKGVEN